MTTSLKRFLLIFGALTFVGLMGAAFWGVFHANGIVLADGVNPIGGDFVNLWTVGHMVLDGRVADIYRPEAFQHYQIGLVGSEIGFRLWAYPPHSLALAVPFGLLPYLPAYVLWSLLGLVVLALGARAAGFGRVETAVLVFSPATALCVYYGQTGNLVTGLMLIALAAPARGRVWPAVVASILTIKPQTGFLLPVTWAAERRWSLLAATVLAVLAVLGATVLWLGLDPWMDYVGRTLPLLSQFERHGTGPFRLMIPSVFMSASILSEDGDLAILIHMAFAAIMLVLAIALMLKATTAWQRQALTLVAIALITPYIHIYDLGLVLAAALLLVRNTAASGDAAMTSWRERGLLFAWGLPYLTMVVNRFGMPVAPLVLLGLLALVAETILPRTVRLFGANRI